jgi:lipoprotein-releasing system permease protein
MASPLSLLIGLRFSRGRRRGGMVSLISVISTVGIALCGGVDRWFKCHERI